jgi:hypothetical protein
MLVILPKYILLHLCLGHLPIHEPSLSKNGSQSDENETYSDQEFDNEFREIPTFQPDYMKIESEFTPTEETVAGFNKVIIISSPKPIFVSLKMK